MKAFLLILVLVSSVPIIRGVRDHAVEIDGSLHTEWVVSDMGSTPATAQIATFTDAHGDEQVLHKPLTIHITSDSPIKSSQMKITVPLDHDRTFFKKNGDLLAVFATSRAAKEITLRYQSTDTEFRIYTVEISKCVSGVRPLAVYLDAGQKQEWGFRVPYDTIVGKECRITLQDMRFEWTPMSVFEGEIPIVENPTPWLRNVDGITREPTSAPTSSPTSVPTPLPTLAPSPKPTTTSIEKEATLTVYHCALMEVSCYNAYRNTVMFWSSAAFITMFYGLFRAIRRCASKQRLHSEAQKDVDATATTRHVESGNVHALTPPPPPPEALAGTIPPKPKKRVTFLDHECDNSQRLTSGQSTTLADNSEFMV